MPSYQISTTISPEYFALKNKHGIKIASALRAGLDLILAEMGLKPYDDTLNIVEKMNQYRKMAESALQELVTLRKKGK